EAAGRSGNYSWQHWPGRCSEDRTEQYTVAELLWDGQCRGVPGLSMLPEWYRREPNAFVGRVKLINTVRDWMNTGDTPVLALCGDEGIGKTRLAIELAFAVKIKGYCIQLGKEAVGESSQITGR